MKTGSKFTARYQIEFSSADPANTLRQLNQAGIRMYRVCYIDTYTICFEIRRKPENRIRQILDRYAQTYQITPSETLASKLSAIFHRPILLTGMMLLVFLTLFLPTRVLFVKVCGNETIPDSKIISVADECGIRFGAVRREVRSEAVKNQMLAQLPQLEWLGVNTYGCVAEISVREGQKQQAEPAEASVASIIAARDGVVLNCTTLQGTQICKTGQAVSKGQLLISGYTDCGIFIQGTRARGEVLAATIHDINLIALNTFNKRVHLTDEKWMFRLSIGNNLINLSKDSGISPISCVKIYREYPLTLPGGFTLPVSLQVDQLIYYDTVQTEEEPQWLLDGGRKYLNSRMIAGKIISEDFVYTHLKGVTSINGRFNCTEMIGQIKFEETI